MGLSMTETGTESDCDTGNSSGKKNGGLAMGRAIEE